MLLVGQKEGHPACKKTVVRCRHGCLSGASCRLAHGRADASAAHCLASGQSAIKRVCVIHVQMLIFHCCVVIVHTRLLCAFYNK